MLTPPRPTEFLPAERADAAELARHVALVARSPQMIALLDATLGFALVLNRHRQIVHVNGSASW